MVVKVRTSVSVKVRSRTKTSPGLIESLSDCIVRNLVTGRARMFQTDLLKGRTIVVTGGGTGLGAEMARRFAGLGAHAVVLGRRKEKLDEVVASIVAAGGKASAHSCDVREAGAGQEGAGKIGEVHGLVNKAAGNFPAASEASRSNGFKTVGAPVLNG